MGDLSLALLGPPQVRHADQTVQFSTRKELALLVYLAVEGRVQARQTLSEHFWPDQDARHGRADLRITLLHLRHLLGEDGDRDAVPHLLITRDTLGLNLTSALDLDLQALHEAWTLAHASSRTALPMSEDAQRPLIARLQRAIGLPRGAFLEGFWLRDAPAFDDWVRSQREYWHLHTNEIFDRLSHLQFEAGELESAIETVNRWLILDPLQEDAYQRLMRLHFAAGDRSAALHAYDTCQVMLSTHLQTGPAPETVALASQMRAVALPRRRETPPAALSPTALLDGPLLGRTTEQRTLIKLYHAVQRGQTQVVLLEGEMGIGKTRLASEFLAWAEIEGADVLRGQAFEGGGQLPYRPVIEALRPCIERENAPDDLLSDTWLAELARLLPEVSERYPDLLAGAADMSVARHRLFEAVARLGQALAARTPLVVFIDDVQWADAGSLDLLHYLARRFAESRTPALLLLTQRLEERENQRALAEWRTGMDRAVPLTRLPLGPLALEDILRLLQVIEGKGGRPAADLERFGQWLFAETEGQPFYLMEMLKVLLERGVLASHPNDEGGWTLDFPAAMAHETVVRGFFPPSVREVIRVRLDRLTPNAFALLVAATVLGQASTFARLCQVAGLAEQDGLPALDEVLHSGLLQTSAHEAGEAEGMAPGRYGFAHAQIRAVVSAEAGEARRSIFHRRAWHALQAAGAPAAELAYHARAAGLAQPSFHWSLVAGDEALRVAAVRDAISFYEQAQHLLVENVQGRDLGSTLPASQIEQLYTQLGRAYELHAEWEKARTVYTVLLTYAQETSQPVMEEIARNRLATLAAR